MEFDAPTIMGALAALTAVVAGIVQAGKFFSKFTETTKDDEFFEKAEGVLEALPSAPEAPEEE